MTNEEVIKILKGLQDSDYSKYSEALETAIRSLEAWDIVKEEIKNYDNFIICANGQIGIHIDKVLEIIDKHLSEVSE